MFDNLQMFMYIWIHLCILLFLSRKDCNPNFISLSFQSFLLSLGFFSNVLQNKLMYC